MACSLPWVSFRSPEYPFNHHLFSYFFELWRLLTQSTFPNTFLRKVNLSQEWQTKNCRRQSGLSDQSGKSQNKVFVTIGLPKKEENKVKMVSLEMRNDLRIYKPSFWHRVGKTYYLPSSTCNVLAIQCPSLRKFRYLSFIPHIPEQMSTLPQLKCNTLLHSSMTMLIDDASHHVCY